MPKESDFFHGLLDVSAEEAGGAADQMRLALMGIELDRDLARGCSGIGEILGPLFDPESEKVFGERRLFATLEFRDGLEPIDVAAVENERISVLLSAVRHGTIYHDDREFYPEPAVFCAVRNFA